MTMAEKETGNPAQKAGPDTENNVKCSFCGNDASCDECRKSPDQSAEHVCYECYQQMAGQMPEGRKIHVCIPPDKMAEMYSRFIDDVTSHAFDELWNAEKKRIKELSRQEIAQACFFEGARFMQSFLQKMQAENQEKDEEKGGSGEKKAQAVRQEKEEKK